MRKKLYSVACYLVMTTMILSCSSVRPVMQYSKRSMSDQEANGYIEEIYYHGIPQSCTKVEIDDNKVRAVFSGSVKSMNNGFPANGVSTLFFKQITDISYNSASKTDKIAWGKGLFGADFYIVVIKTRDQDYLLTLNSVPACEDFINAINHYKDKNSSQTKIE